MLRDTQRIKQCFRQSADDQIGSWTGGLCGPVSDQLAVVGYDDGDLITQSIEELRGVFEMGKLKVHSRTGLANDQECATLALALCPMKHGGSTYPVGVSLGDEAKFCGEYLYTDHIVAVEVLDNLGLQLRPSRAKSAALDTRAGYRTFRRGDSRSCTRELHETWKRLSKV
eukprot:3105674-Prymnesium_polylepis.1